MWRLVCASAQGTSHAKSGVPCQDYVLARSVQPYQETVLVACCADGAGSASHAEVGSALACSACCEIVINRFENGLAMDAIDRELALEWCQQIRKELESAAARLDVQVRQLACTFLLAIIGESAGVFVQIGDGAIVVGAEDCFQAIFWPHSGEYLNTTNFLTDHQFETHLLFDRQVHRIDEVGLMTDGLQMLALCLAKHEVHSPFFRPMFRVLRDSPNPEELVHPLREFLNSPPVNERTDDDKTLLLASRRPGDESKEVFRPQSETG